MNAVTTGTASVRTCTSLDMGSSSHKMQSHRKPSCFAQSYCNYPFLSEKRSLDLGVAVTFVCAWKVFKNSVAPPPFFSYGVKCGVMKERDKTELALLSHCRDLRLADLVVELCSRWRDHPAFGGSGRDQQRAHLMKGKQGSRKIDGKEVKQKYKAAFKGGLLESNWGKTKSFRSPVLLLNARPLRSVGQGLFSTFLYTPLVINVKQEFLCCLASGFSLLQYTWDIQVNYSKPSTKDLRPQPTPLPSQQNIFPPRG